ncbi:MAG: DUF2585 family protein [Parerythrobacter sp.]
MTSLVPSRTAVLASLGITAFTVLILLAIDRPPICECGYVKLWHGQINDAGNSQHIADWYTPSHIIYGTIFYAPGWLLFTKWGWHGADGSRWGLALAMFLQSAWKILENTPLVI